MTKVIYIFHAFLFLFVSIQVQSFAQEKWRLEECIDYALKNNSSIKVKEISLKDSEIALSAAKWEHSPTVYASSSGNISFGRVLDVTSYQFIENKIVLSSSTSISADMILFSGLRKFYNQQKANLTVVESMLGLEQEIINLKVAVIQAFLEMMCAKENVHNIELTVDDIVLQKQNSEKRLKRGIITESDLLQIEAKLAETEYNLISAKNILETSRLAMCQLLELDQNVTFDIIDYENTSPLLINIDSLSVINIIEDIPEIKLMDVAIEQRKRDVQIAKSFYYPSISLNVGYGTNYADSNQKILLSDDGTYRYEAYPFVEQYKNNSNFYLSLGIKIPIFDKLSVVKNVQRQKLFINNAVINKNIRMKQIYKTINQALIDAVSAKAKYEASQKHLKYAMETYRQIVIKFNYGAVSTLDYSNALTSVAQANSNALQAKYEFLIMNEILKLYFGL